MVDATRGQDNHFTSERGSGAIQKQETPSTCCGGPAPAGTNACCAQDAEAKSAGRGGCGCGSVAPAGKQTGCC
jgi:hypothetical protein